MLLLKPKQNMEFLPPPPPFPTFEIEDSHPNQQEIAFKPSLKQGRRHPRIARNEEIIDRLEDGEFSEFQADLNVDNLAQVEFPERLESEQPISNSHLKDARDEINEAIQNVKKLEKKSFFSKIFSKNQDQLPLPKSGIKLIEAKISYGKDALNRGDIQSAKQVYIDIMKNYNALTNDEKKRIYEQITKFYYERKQLEG